jgi:hypothetical protein
MASKALPKKATVLRACLDDVQTFPNHKWGKDESSASKMTVTTSVSFGMKNELDGLLGDYTTCRKFSNE